MKNRSRTLAIWIGGLAAPLVASVVFYFATDPFCVLHRPLYAPGHPVAINRDYASTELYLRQQPAHDYDSFVFGNSRSLAFRCPEWLAAARRPEGRCFHFDAWKESLFGLEAKVRLVDELGNGLRDALIVVDGSLLAEIVPSSEPVFRSHPRLVEQSWVGFEADYLVDFFSNHFLIKYVDYTMFGKVRSYMGAEFNARNFTHILETNDELFSAADDRIAREGEGYWARRPEVFVPRSGRTASPTLLDPERRLLASIQSVFAHRGTRVRIVVSPLYDQIRLHPDDLQVLRATFGADAVADFSGENPLTADVRNFYESSHYRPTVARQILANLYSAP